MLENILFIAQNLKVLSALGADITMAASETIKIYDNNGPDSLNMWLIIMALMFILYIVMSLVHDINREKKIEKLKKEQEEEKNKKLMEALFDDES